MPTTAVIGASRGIGLALLTQASKTSQVIGTVRSTPPPATPNTKYLTLDMTSESSVSSAASQISDGIDTLIINAAMGDDEKLVQTSDETLTRYLDVNVVGPHRVIRAFLPALRKGKGRKIVLISSGSGSCGIQVETGGKRGFAGPYSVSKAALNMLAIQYHNELKDEGFTVVALHPGWVATDMGNKAGSGGMDVNVSAEKCLGVIEGLEQKDSAGFFNYEGKTLPW